MKFGKPTITKSTFTLVLACITFLGILSSCVNPKTIVYFQGDPSKYSIQNIDQKYVPTIQPNDLLSIVVGSLNAEANEVFNSANTATTTSMNYSTASGSGGRIQPLGYLVDYNGDVNIPLVGKIKISGMETLAAADTIKKRLEKYLKEPSVIVRNLNFKVSILGEVSRPAVYVVPDEKITLPEVLSLAGDLTIYGKRDNVLVIREENGKREYARVDLTSRETFNSPYYYIHKNDIIYVEPSKTRMNATDRMVQLAPLFISLAVSLSLIFTRIP